MRWREAIDVSGLIDVTRDGSLGAAAHLRRPCLWWIDVAEGVIARGRSPPRRMQRSEKERVRTWWPTPNPMRTWPNDPLSAHADRRPACVRAFPCARPTSFARTWRRPANRDGQHKGGARTWFKRRTSELFSYEWEL